MKQIATLNTQQRKFIFEQTAFKMNVQPIVVEKDYWVCLVLDFLFNKSSFKENFIFKGGTSLSKCYGVIKRFSEDIDLILKWSVLNLSGEDVYIARSKTQNSKFAEKLNLECSKYLRNCFVKQFQKELETFLGFKISLEFDEENEQTINIFYPSLYENEYIKPFIRLEIGPVSLQNPEVICNIKPYCADFYPNQFSYSSFDIPTISIERTFYEKLLILSNENDRPIGNRRPLRYSRHYYDVYKIFASNYFKQVLERKDLFDQIKSFKNLFYRNGWSKYDEVTLKNIKIIPNDSLADYLKRDYKSMENMFFETPPSFEELLNEISKLEILLHSK